MKTLNLNSPEAERWLLGLEARRTEDSAATKASVAGTLRDVRERGDAAVAEAIARFDRASISPSSILTRPKAAAIDRSLADAIREAAKRIEKFHSQQKIDSYTTKADGIELTQRVRPLRRVGIYVPGGRAVYVSTLLMCAIPARLAGVKEIVVATSPRAAAEPELQYCCELLGITELYCAGGAAGIAALAYGTESLRRVDKIVGPGNQFVTAAKELVQGTVAIDMIAGPTELALIADESADARLVAVDLLAQAEHGESSSVVCLTTSEDVAKNVGEAVASELATCDPSSAALVSIERNSAIFVAPDYDSILATVNRLGPEHVSIQTANARELAERIEDAGAIFCGAAGVAAGDYIVGTNHVLPTAGTARFSSPLSVYDFVKRSSVIVATEEGMASVADAAARIATYEGLPFHAKSMERRGKGAESWVRSPEDGAECWVLGAEGVRSPESGVRSSESERTDDFAVRDVAARRGAPSAPTSPSAEGRARDARLYEDPDSTQHSAPSTGLAPDSALRTSDSSLSTQHTALSTSLTQNSAPSTRVRSAITSMKAYSLEPLSAPVKMNQNENPYDFPAELKQRVSERIAARQWNIYPDFENERLRSALASAYGIAPESILAGNGSNELLAAVISTFVAPGTRAIFPSPTFALYEKIVAVCGGESVPVEFDPSSGLLPLQRLIDEVAIDPRRSVVIVCSPNNPTGSVLPNGGLDELLATGATVVLDRAYGEFGDDAYPGVRERLVTLSTFSKSWGLAALRIGWLSATPEDCIEIRKVKLPYSVDVMSEEAAVVALEGRTIIEARLTELVSERDRLFASLTETEGVTPFPSRANFVSFHIDDASAKQVFGSLHAAGILIRDISSYPRMKNCLRVSVGTPEENEKFVKSLRGILRRGAPSAPTPSSNQPLTTAESRSIGALGAPLRSERSER